MNACGDDAAPATDAGFVDIEDTLDVTMDRTMADVRSAEDVVSDAPMDIGEADVAEDPMAPDVTTDTMVFVAVGNAGRHLRSIDDGRTWIDDASDRGGRLCTSATPGEMGFCFEGANAVRGAVYAEGYFFATYGWSREPGSNSLRRSRDGASWEAALEPGGFGDVAAGLGRVVVSGRSGTRNMLYSDDFGGEWTSVPNGYEGWGNLRRMKFVSALGGRFIVKGNGNGFDIAFSDDGSTFAMAETVPDSCTRKLGLSPGIASVGDRVLLIFATGDNCISDDGGAHWRRVDGVGTRLTSLEVVEVEGEVQVWSEGAMHTSADGERWTRTPLTGRNVSIGPVARNPRTGTYVAVSSGFLNGYENQAFFRSEDGLSWQRLDDAAAPTGHPIREIVVGAVAD